LEKQNELDTNNVQRPWHHPMAKIQTVLEHIENRIVPDLDLIMVQHIEAIRIDSLEYVYEQCVDYLQITD
jgi:hypothetical protein